MSVAAAPVAPSRTRSIAPPVLAAATLTALTAYTYVRDPFQPGAFPTCLFYAGTGMYCPGCGGLRAVHTLLHGDVLHALQLNSLALLVVIPATAVAVVWWLGAALGKPWRAPRVSRGVVIGAGAVVLAFTIARNLPPFAPYLAP